MGIAAEVEARRQAERGRQAREHMGALVTDLRMATKDVAADIRGAGWSASVVRARRRYVSRSPARIPVHGWTLRVPGAGTLTFAGDDARVVEDRALLPARAQLAPCRKIETDGLALIEPDPSLRGRIVVGHEGAVTLEPGGASYTLSEDRPNGSQGLPLADAQALVWSALRSLLGVRLVGDPEG